MSAYIANRTNWDALLQEDYVQQIVAQVNDKTPFKDKLRRVGLTGGRRRFYAIQTGLSQGVGARDEGDSSPDYGAGEYSDVTVSAKYNYSAMKITGPAEEFSNKAAFAQFGLRAVKDTKTGLNVDVGRQCWGDGQGILGLVNNGGGYAAGTSTIAVDSPYGVLWGSLSTNTTMLLRRRATVVFGTETNGGLGYTITATTTTTITVSPPLVNAIADNTVIRRKGVTATSEIEGIMVGGATAAFMTTLGLTTIYHNIDRATISEFEGNVINAAAALSLINIRTLRDAIFKRTDDEQSDLIMTSTEGARDYEALLQPAQRFVPATSLNGGQTSLEHDALRVSKDSRAPTKAFWITDTQTIAWAQTREPHWRTDDAGAMMLPIAGQDAREALLRYYGNLDFEEPRRTGLLYNLTMS